MRNMVWLALGCVTAAAASNVASSPFEPSVYAYVTLPPATEIQKDVRAIRRKDIVFQQPLGSPVVARITAPMAWDEGKESTRAAAGLVFYGRPYRGNFGNGRIGSLAYCGKVEWKWRNRDNGKWRTAPSCFFDSDDDSTLDRWRPADPAAQFGSKANGIPPVPYLLEKNVPLENGRDLKVVYVGGRDIAKSFAVRFGDDTATFPIQFEASPGPDGETRLRLQGSELSVISSDDKSAQLRVLKPFDTGEPFGFVSTPRFNVIYVR